MFAIHVVVPAYNPGEVIVGVVERARLHADAVLIVDDGCDEENRLHLERCADLPGVSRNLSTTLRHRWLEITEQAVVS